MRQKLIITLWKAQLSSPLPNDSIYCLITYNNQSKTSKYLQSKTSLQWKQTFIFPLAKQELPLKVDFISLKKGQQIHFAQNNVAESLSVAKAVLKVPVKAPTKGPLPSKIDIIDSENGSTLGKVFIEYQVLKTQVTNLVQKILDYEYMLKLSNLNVTFLRTLKKVPTFYLKLKYGQKSHREDFPFSLQNGRYVYTYPIKLYMNKEIQMALQLEVKQNFGTDFQNPNQSIKSISITEKRSQMSTMLKKSNSIIDIGVDTKISGMMDLNFKENTKINKKVSLTTFMKNQQRQIGSIQFQVEAIFKTPEQKLAFEEQKRSLVQKDNKQKLTLRKKKSINSQNLQQSNGMIILNTIMGRLELSEQNSRKIYGKNISLSLNLGKQFEQSSVLQNPGNQLIFLDQFNFKRTWQQIIKFVLEINDGKGLKIPIFFASVNLRELFQIGRVYGKKIKVFDELKNYCGVLVLDMEYKEEEKKSKEKSFSMQKKISKEETKKRQQEEKREKINERLRQREEQKRQKMESSRSMSLNKQKDVITMAQALDLRDLILPPLRSRKISSEMTSELRYSTITPSQTSQDSKKQKFRSANIYNSNGGIKFARSPRFEQNYENNKSGDSYSLVRESDFDIKKKKGPFIGYGDKHDFTQNVKKNPGIGKYQIPSLWDKYQ